MANTTKIIRDVGNRFDKYVLGVNPLGDTWFVDSVNGNANNSGTEKDRAVVAIDAAINLAAANDTIIVLPGHAESVVADSGIDIDKAGIAIIGIGRGTARPTITFTTATTADIKLAAANVRVENILFKAGFDSLTGPIEISAAYCQLINCEFQDGPTSTFDTVDVVIVTSAGDNCEISGFRHIGVSDAIQSCIQLAAGATDPHVHDCYITGSYAVGNIECISTTDLVRIHDNLLINTNATDTCIDVQGTTTGSIYDNYMEIATDAQDTSITVDNDCSLYENYFVNLDGEAGGIFGTAST